LEISGVRRRGDKLQHKDNSNEKKLQSGLSYVPILAEWNKTHEKQKARNNPTFQQTIRILSQGHLVDIS